MSQPQPGQAAGYLTEPERRALALVRDLVNVVSLEVMGNGSELAADHREFVGHVHAIQHMIMAQAAARAYPEDYRLLGMGWRDG